MSPPSRRSEILIHPTLLNLSFRGAERLEEQLRSPHPPHYPAFHTCRIESLQIPPNATILEYSVHSISRSLWREISAVWVELKEEKDYQTAQELIESSAASGSSERPRPWHSVKVIQLFQRSCYDLVSVNDETSWERDLLLEYTYAFTDHVRQALSPKFTDISDPPTGLPYYTRSGPSLFPDVESAVQFLKYPTTQIGACKIILHPKWGSRNYPTCMVTDAPVEDIRRVFEEMAGLTLELTK
ncbi:hypothetical protein HDU85_003448 [Gaertneriomyces sp. JEL0708]|nr:hypothetical protein HDU85_003448 [Gaertneriomyces sp. JEL0708]